MALSEAEMAAIRMYLGWSDRFHQTDSKLEQAFNALATRPDTVTLIQTELGRCSTIDTALASTQKRLKAREVGPIKLAAELEMKGLRSQGRQAAGRIASLLGVEIRNDAFGASSPQRAGTYGLVGGDGNTLKVW